MTLLSALAMVGGPRRDAATKSIKIYRQDEATSKLETIDVDYGAIKSKKQPDIELKPYDIIDVPAQGPFGKDRLLQTFAGGVLGGMTQNATYIPTRVMY
jgi:protein involved in polysaccharide export with SLBB domain